MLSKQFSSQWKQVSESGQGSPKCQQASGFKKTRLSIALLEGRLCRLPFVAKFLLGWTAPMQEGYKDAKLRFCMSQFSYLKVATTCILEYSQH